MGLDEPRWSHLTYITSTTPETSRRATKTKKEKLKPTQDREQHQSQKNEGTSRREEGRKYGATKNRTKRRWAIKQTKTNPLDPQNGAPNKPNQYTQHLTCPERDDGPPRQDEKTKELRTLHGTENDNKGGKLENTKQLEQHEPKENSH